MAKFITESNSLLMITSIYNSLSKAEQKVADTVLENAEHTVYSSITDLAELADVGETTVIRFCRKLGFRGFQEFKLAIAQDLVSPNQQVYGKIEDSDSVEVVCQKMTSNHIQTLEDTMRLLQTTQLEKAAEAIIQSRKLYFFGVGSSGITAMDAEYRFMRLGFDAHSASDSHIIAMQCALATVDDVVVGISSSGSTKDLVDAMQIARKNDAHIICLTNHARSPITSYANSILLASSKESPLQGGAFASKLGQIHVLEILSTLVAMKKREGVLKSLEDTAKAVLDKLY